MKVTYFILVSTLSLSLPATAQTVDPAPSGNEVQQMYVNPDTGAAVITPGDALTNSMPEGPQTELTFPEVPEGVHEDDTTVIYGGSDAGDGGSGGGDAGD